MKQRTIFTSSGALLLLVASMSYGAVRPTAVNAPLHPHKVPPAMALQVEPFELDAVQLLGAKLVAIAGGIFDCRILRRQ